VKAFMNRRAMCGSRSMRALQASVARILSKYAARSATGHAAAVVLDPDTGDVLAVGSYPFPGVAPESRTATTQTRARR
jgi:hypothetical protein